MGKLVWEDTTDVQIDSTLVFGPGYDFLGLECLRQEADTPLGRFMVWPEWSGRSWALYGGTDGWLQQGFPNAEAAKAEVERFVGAAGQPS